MDPEKLDLLPLETPNARAQEERALAREDSDEEFSNWLRIGNTEKPIDSVKIVRPLNL